MGGIAKSISEVLGSMGPGESGCLAALPPLRSGDSSASPRTGLALLLDLAWDSGRGSCTARFSPEQSQRLMSRW